MACYWRSDRRSVILRLQNELDLVVLLEELPAKGLPRGQVGRVIQEMGSGVYEVEFSDSDGAPFAFLPLR